jgi:hypothetical protein
MLEGHHYQNGYVTRNLEKWVDTFQKRAQIDHIVRAEGDNELLTPNGPATLTVKIAKLWMGDMQFELIQPVAGNVAIFSDVLPADDSLQFHHICMRVLDWDDFRQRVDRQPYPVVLEGNEEPVQFLYLDTRAFLGHYVEYSCMSDERWAQTAETVRRSSEAAAAQRTETARRQHV